jgi:hypothetical protein
MRPAQFKYVSIEQHRYQYVNHELTKVATNHYLIELTFNIKKGYIRFANKDTGFEYDYSNIIEVDKKKSWRAYSKKLDRAYLISMVYKLDGPYISLDDGVIVYEMKISETKLE